MKGLNEQMSKVSESNKTKVFGPFQIDGATCPVKKFIYDSHGLIVMWTIGIVFTAIL